MKSTLVRAASATALALSLAPAVAQAQSAQPSPAPAVEDEAVVVTGSRVITNGDRSPTPLTVLNPEALLTTKPTTVYENLVELPAFSGSRGASNGPVTSSPNSAGGNQPNGAVSSLNLRNLGPLRNLVLFDGHRAPPTSVDGLVDVSVLPQMLIKRVDVVTGGASAVYGSDAITGVTNFITDTDFNGLKINLQGGISAQSDAGSYQVGVAGGTDLFGGRGHIEASYQRLHNDSLYEYERDWFAPRWSVHGNGTTLPWRLIANVTNSTATFGGSIACPNGNLTGCPATTLAGYTFHVNGIATPYDPGLTGAANGLSLSTVQIGGDGAYFVNVALRSKITQDQFFARFDYDLTDAIQASIAGSFVASDMAGNTGTQRSFTPGWNIGACNAFLATTYQTQLGCTPANSGTAGEPTFKFEKQFNSLDNYGIGQNNSLSNRNWFVMANLNGDLGESFRWDVTYTHSDAEMEVTALQQNRQHVYAALDAVVNPGNGQIVCRVTLTNPTVNPGCVPLNPFGPTAASREAIYYLFDTIYNTTHNKLDGLSGSLTGSPFSLWAGPVDMALSAEWRELTMDLDTTSFATDLLNCTGLRFGNCNATLPTHPNTWLPEHGVTQGVREVAYELNLPLLADLPMFQSLAFNGAVRRTSYDNQPGDSGFTAREFDATTWKAGLVWELNDTLTIRSTRSRDIRAPSLYDLYQPITIGNTTNNFDYLLSPAGVAISPRLKTGGNPNLTPEIGDTFTVGLVARPFGDLSFAIDYYNIIMSEALFSLNGSTQVIQQACYASGGSSPLCQLQERPNGFTDTSLSNAMTAFYTRQVNIAGLKTHGLDFEANWNGHLINGNDFTVRALVTYQPSTKYIIPFAAVQDVAGVAYPQIGGLPQPVWRGSIFAHLQVTDRFSVDVQQRWRSELHFSSDPTQPNEAGHTDAVTYTNLTLTYDLPFAGGDGSMFFNVQNLFDVEPPPAGSLNATFPGQFGTGYAVGDDVVGRYFTVGMRARF